MDLWGTAFQVKGHLLLFYRVKGSGTLCGHWDIFTVLPVHVCWLHLKVVSMSLYVWLSAGRLPARQSPSARLHCQHTRGVGQYPQGLCLQAAVQVSCLLFPSWERVYLREVRKPAHSSNPSFSLSMLKTCWTLCAGGWRWSRVPPAARAEWACLFPKDARSRSTGTNKWLGTSSKDCLLYYMSATCCRDWRTIPAESVNCFSFIFTFLFPH